MIKTICVYCGSSDKMHPLYLQAAREMGRAIARHGLHLTYGAGSTGLMGAVADGVLEQGGQVTGVIPEVFATPQLMHNGLTSLEIVSSMHARKMRLVEISDAFVALPGGYGTFEEFFEILTWAQIGLHRKPIGLLNSNHYYDVLLQAIEHAWAEGFLYAEHRQLFTCAGEPEALLDSLMQYQYPGGTERWLRQEE